MFNNRAFGGGGGPFDHQGQDQGRFDGPFGNNEFRNDFEQERSTTPVPDNEDNNDWNNDNASSQQKSPPRPASSSNRDPRSRDPRDPRSRDVRNVQQDKEAEKEKRMLEVDLSMFGDLELPVSEKEEDTDNELGLPFKPHIPNAVAKEINASIHSHSPLEYRLRKITLSKPDYSEVLSKRHLPMSKIQLDPRLEKFAANAAAMQAKKAPPSPKDSSGGANSSSVYNPSRELYQQRNDTKDVYSPTQDVQDLYKPPAALQRPPNESYNPREDLIGNNPGVWDTNYSSAEPAPVQSRDPRANRRDPRQRRD